LPVGVPAKRRPKSRSKAQLSSGNGSYRIHSYVDPIPIRGEPKVSVSIKPERN